MILQDVTLYNGCPQDSPTCICVLYCFSPGIIPIIPLIIPLALQAGHYVSAATRQPRKGLPAGEDLTFSGVGRSRGEDPARKWEGPVGSPTVPRWLVLKACSPATCLSPPTSLPPIPYLRRPTFRFLLCPPFPARPHTHPPSLPSQNVWPTDLWLPLTSTEQLG